MLYFSLEWLSAPDINMFVGCLSSQVVHGSRDFLNFVHSLVSPVVRTVTDTITTYIVGRQ